jgi:hypothetical protein
MTPPFTSNPGIPTHSENAVRRAPDVRTAGCRPAARRKEVVVCLRTYITVTVAP